VGIVALLGVLISTWWVPSFHITMLAGGPWLLFITLCYLAWGRAHHTAHEVLAGRTVLKTNDCAELGSEE
jgi:hypothetical protein